MESTAQAFPVEWRCKRCRFERDLVMTGEASFENDSETGGRRRVRSPWDDVQARVAFFTCPLCGFVDYRARALNALGRMKRLLVLLAFVSIFAATDVWRFAVLGVVVATIVLLNEVLYGDGSANF